MFNFDHMAQLYGYLEYTRVLKYWIGDLYRIQVAKAINSVEW